MAKDYQKEIDFAFFAVNFGYSKSDYETLTPREKVFIYKAWENKVVSDSQMLSNAVSNAVSNSLRKKGKKAVPLWKKQPKRLDKETAKENLNLVTELENKEGKTWVDLIYQANGIDRNKVMKRGRK